MLIQWDLYGFMGTSHWRCNRDSSPSCSVFEKCEDLVDDLKRISFSNMDKHGICIYIYISIHMNVYLYIYSI